MKSPEANEKMIEMEGMGIKLDAIVFIDSEIHPESGKILDLGAVKPDNSGCHSSSQKEFSNFISGSKYICGHNIFKHDLNYIGHLTGRENPVYIDTLCLSPLLFPGRPYHALLKDDKLQTDELNNPLNDSIKAMRLFYDELNAFEALDLRMKRIYYELLHSCAQFQGFFQYIGFKPYIAFRRFWRVEDEIKKVFFGTICGHSDLSALVHDCPVELAYSLALITARDVHSITPPWVLKVYPKVDYVLKKLRNTPCEEGCRYCDQTLSARTRLKEIFGYDSFRTYDGEPLQEKAAEAAVHNHSLLAIFPTGGGKSITFQLPALIAGETVRGLTVVISPLQSLMKDQVDNLERFGIVDAVTINGLLSPIERAEALERVASGMATILYISPEQLRSKTIERLLLSRNVVRFVIDEAHCFSAWGQDFRVDYLYIGDFIRELQNQKDSDCRIPVSCFTATAKQKVISDIRDYFKQKLNLDLELYATNASRTNLTYAVLYKETEADKYNALRSLMEQKDCPAIVYVSRVKKTYELAEKLTNDGFSAKPYNGKMESTDKIANQEAFIQNQIKIIVATSAFGMGVDKKDVKLVVHYDISDSLENYVQETGRAGRDQSIQAECYVLFNDQDLDKHFILLNQTKLSISEIQQVWKAVKDMTRHRERVCSSPLEIARQAGWDESVSDVETRVKTAIAALENAGYVKRGKNVPHVYATSILVKNMEEASKVLESSPQFNDVQRMNARRIIKSLISSRSISKADKEDAESRVDYLSDMLGIEKSSVIEAINLMRAEGLLADSQDMTAYVRRSHLQNKSASILNKFSKLEKYLLSNLLDSEQIVNLKEINEQALREGIHFSTVKDIRTILTYWIIKGYIQKSQMTSDNRMEIIPLLPFDRLMDKFNRRVDICRYIVEELFRRSFDRSNGAGEEVLVLFSVLELWNGYKERPRLNFDEKEILLQEIEDSLLYLSKIGSLSLEGGFLVLYNGMEIVRLIKDNKIRYKRDDYRMLDEFYKQKIQQIHIVGEYANMMVKNYNDALQFVNDYFQMDYKLFIAKYFKGNRSNEINRNITPEKYNQLFGGLSAVQTEIIRDDTSKYIVVAAGPGSGKTRVLVHKLASLLLLEDVKHEQLLMLTFSRAAATEFKKRLIQLIGNAANFVDVKTFHSYCFDLLGKIGDLEGADDVVKNAAEMIQNGQVEIGRITKSVVVIDEAQDMNQDEFALIKALMERNEEMRVIAVGDDDQNVFEFRGSDSEYLKRFISEFHAKKYEMSENYRSRQHIVQFANVFVKNISNRMKNTDICSMHSESGSVYLVGHRGRNLEIPVVNQIMATYKDGTACVLTRTNEEALRVLGLLVQKGMRAKLIQSNEGFNLYNLIELRFFICTIRKKLNSPVISDELWNDAKEQLFSVCKKSSCLEICRNLFAEFEAINPTKYYTDLEQFIRESNLEDFYGDEKGSVIVSTMHKAKGREFDCVYMLINNARLDTDAEKRAVYVGLTRAKRELYVHYNNNFFDSVFYSGAEKHFDNRIYPEPEEIMLQLSYRDVYLDYFKGKQEIVSRMVSGAKLELDQEYMRILYKGKSERILRYSKRSLEIIRSLQRKGYVPYRAQSRFVVKWKAKEDEEEITIILPDIYFRKGI